jgi:hypothetical protein
MNELRLMFQKKFTKKNLSSEIKDEKKKAPPLPYQRINTNLDTRSRSK